MFILISNHIVSYSLSFICYSINVKSHQLFLLNRRRVLNPLLPIEKLKL